MNIDHNITMNGMEFRTPLLTGSGTFGYGDEFLSLIDYDPFGGVVTKSLSVKPRKGNPPPRICETPGGGVINSIGLANPGVDVFLEEKRHVLPIDKTRVFLSIFGETVEEFVTVLTKLEDIEGISGYELNLSCPNVKQGGIAIGGDAGAIAQTVRECRAITDKFIAVKLTPHHTQVAPLAEAAAKNGASALTMINTLVGMMIDVESRKPLLGTVTGGYSGLPLKPVALAKVWQASKAVDIPIWASGGIVNGTDCIEFLLAGASGLQLGSVLFTDPYSPGRILKEMDQYCLRHGVISFRELIGALEKP